MALKKVIQSFLWMGMVNLSIQMIVKVVSQDILSPPKPLLQKMLLQVRMHEVSKVISMIYTTLTVKSVIT